MTIWQYGAVAIYLAGVLTGMAVMAYHLLQDPAVVRRHRARMRWARMRLRLDRIDRALVEEDELSARRQEE